MTLGKQPVIDRDEIDVVVFDMDGVVTRTAGVHAAAWKRLFDTYLEKRARSTGEPFVPFAAETDYRAYVDGKPRYDGVASFLASRGIELPGGTTDDPPGAETVCGLGNAKNDYFVAEIEEHGVRVFESTVALVKELQAKAFGTAIISASRNAERVLSAAGVGDLFPVMVDGLVAERLGLKGKPDPAVFIEAARRLGAGPARTAIVEDAIAGVEAGRGGGFALVIGVDRTGDAEGLREHGADVVVPDLADVSVRVADEDPPPPEPALAHLDGIVARLKTGPAVFLDYDGTLTPIVNDPAAALLSPEMRATVARLARDCPVAMISGRDLADVKRLVGIEGIIYSGSHGCDIDGPADLVGRQQRGTEFLPLLDEAEEELTQAIKGIGGAWVERKRFAIAVHYRLVVEVDVPRVTEAFDRVAAGYPTLRRSGGKKVHELRPDIGWDKGRVVLWLLALLRERGRLAQVPLYIGDDVTDEDAFRAIRGQGVTIRVGGPGEATEARYLLADPDEVRTLLDTLATALADGSR